MERTLGFKKSEIDGSEHLFSAGMPYEDLPKKYSYRKYLPNVINQGTNPICVPCSISAYLNWKENLKDGSKKDNKINYFEIYDIKTSQGEGMTFKEAFYYLRHNGVRSNSGKLMIKEYAFIQSIMLLKEAIIMNGPCLGALPVYNYDSEFWNKRYGDELHGYHAISIVGYDEEGFIIRNSWGSGFGSGGYTKIKYDDTDKFVELWTIVE